MKNIYQNFYRIMIFNASALTPEVQPDGISLLLGIE